MTLFKRYLFKSISVHQLANKSWVGTLRKLTADGSFASGESGSLVMEKNNVDLDQPVYFSIVSSNWGSDPGANLLLAAKANLTRLDSNLHYTITGTASVPVPGMSITPKIWQKNETGDVLVYTGTVMSCSAATSCIATGNFTPYDDEIYFANATVLYTAPTSLAGATGTQKYGIATVNAGASSSGGQATDVEGRHFIGSSIVDDAATKQRAIYYNPTVYVMPSRGTIQLRLPGDEIFFFHGHGEPGGIQTSEDNNEWYRAKGDPSGFNFNTIDFSNMKLALLLACSAGATSDTYGNIVDTISDKGGSCAMGFTETIYDPGTVAYSKEFWSQIQNGASFQAAHNAGVEKAKADPSCKGKCDNTCCLDKWHPRGCSGGLKSNGKLVDEIGESKSQPEKVGIEQGYTIAESFAREEYPELFMETTTHRIVLSKSAYDNGQYRDFTYTLDEELYYPDNQTPSHETIRGLNGMSVVLSPYTGGITSSYKWEYPLDANLSLVPTLSEENAAVIAKSVFASKGVTDILPSEWTPWGLCIMTDQNKTQHLTWAFDVTHRMGKAQYLAGGVLYIDAHDGTLVASAEIG